MFFAVYLSQQENKTLTRAVHGDRKRKCRTELLLEIGSLVVVRLGEGVFKSRLSSLIVLL